MNFPSLFPISAILALSLLPILQGQSANCVNIGEDLRAAIYEKPEHVLIHVEDAMIVNEGCAGEIVKAAIEGTGATGDLVYQIVLTATSVSQSSAPAIAKAAITASPNSSVQIKAALEASIAGEKPAKVVSITNAPTRPPSKITTASTAEISDTTYEAKAVPEAPQKPSVSQSGIIPNWLSSSLRVTNIINSKDSADTSTFRAGYIKPNNPNERTFDQASLKALCLRHKDHRDDFKVALLEEIFAGVDGNKLNQTSFNYSSQTGMRTEDGRFLIPLPNHPAFLESSELRKEYLNQSIVKNRAADYHLTFQDIFDFLKSKNIAIVTGIIEAPFSGCVLNTLKRTDKLNVFLIYSNEMDEEELHSLSHLNQELFNSNSPANRNDDGHLSGAEVLLYHHERYKTTLEFYNNRFAKTSEAAQASSSESTPGRLATLSYDAEQLRVAANIAVFGRLSPSTVNE